MESAPTTLALVWFGLLGLILFIYVSLDGFDLGVGLLSLLTRDQERRSLMMASLGSMWHPNQTWLVVLGGMLFGAFPPAYGVVLSAFYLPMLLLLLGLILRGVSFEFQAAARYQSLWRLAFGGGSLLAALAQGFLLGGLLNGPLVAAGQFAGGVWDWLTPFAALVAGGLLCGYALLGATYLVIKTEGELQTQSRRQARAAAWLVAIAALAVAVFAALDHPELTRKWLAPGPLAFLLTIPLTLSGVLLSLRKRREYAPFLWTLAFFAAAFVCLAASLYPCLIPPGLTVAATAAPDNILTIMLVGLVVLLPLMLGYNAYQYRIFWGKVKEGAYGED